MEVPMENPMIEPKELASSLEVEIETLLPTSVLQDVATDDDDDCIICYLTKYRPAKTSCGHSACESCMLHWALTAMDVNLDNNHLQSSLTVEGIKFKCPTCRTYTSAKLDTEQDEKLAAKYPEEYTARAAEFSSAQVESEDENAAQTIVLMFGNSHRKVPPSISPHSGKTRTHEWTFFVQASRMDVIEEVKVVLHPSYRDDRLVILKDPPFSTTHLAWGYFTIYAGIQLKEGWQWVDEEMAIDSSRDRTKDVLPIEWLLEFRENGGQKNRMVKIRKVHDEIKVESEEEEEDLGDLAMWMSEREIEQYKEVRRLRRQARRAEEAARSA